MVERQLRPIRRRRVRPGSSGLQPLNPAADEYRQHVAEQGHSDWCIVGVHAGKFGECGGLIRPMRTRQVSYASNGSALSLAMVDRYWDFGRARIAVALSVARRAACR
jgi:hypothetical protein